MSRVVVLQDKWIKTGSSPVYNENYEVIANIHYHLISLNGKIEIKDSTGNLISQGARKMISLMPKWLIKDSTGNAVGEINRKISFLAKKYEYKSKDGKAFSIKGNISDRKFTVLDNNKNVVINVASVSSIFSLRPHTFLVEIKDDNLDLWECINLVQGVRSLVKAENEANDD